MWRLLPWVLACALLGLGASRQFAVDIDLVSGSGLRVGGVTIIDSSRAATVSSLVLTAAFFTPSSSTQTLRATDAITANAAVVRVEPATIPQKATNNTGTGTLSGDQATSNDLTLTSTVTGYGSNIATTGNSVYVENGHMDANDGSRAFDANTSTYWASPEMNSSPINGVSWIGWDFGAGASKAIRRMRVFQYDAAGANDISSAFIEHSDNGTAWTNDVTKALTAGLNDYETLNLNDYGTHRYWRIRANSNTSGPSTNIWAVKQIEMMEASVSFQFTYASATSSVYTFWPVSTPITLGNLSFDTDASAPAGSGTQGSYIDAITVGPGTFTLTSAPTIASGTDGQQITILNTATSGSLTLQDQGTLSGSNLRLTATTMTLAPRNSIQLLYSGAIGDWLQLGAKAAVL